MPYTVTESVRNAALGAEFSALFSILLIGIQGRVCTIPQGNPERVESVVRPQG